MPRPGITGNRNDIVNKIQIPRQRWKFCNVHKTLPSASNLLVEAIKLHLDTAINRVYVGYGFAHALRDLSLAFKLGFPI